ncbi:unnamed protein product [Vicia faba]|uniref:Late embryogenesis abundant protein n=1 Tax=Vicia faba TaxID=3906 RepID=A0AAV0ZMB5_VICFA|nr:unnamed protein product [Vicia faba]
MIRGRDDAYAGGASGAEFPGTNQRGQTNIEEKTSQVIEAETLTHDHIAKDVDDMHKERVIDDINWVETVGSMGLNHFKSPCLSTNPNTVTPCDEETTHRFTKEINSSTPEQRNASNRTKTPKLSEARMKIALTAPKVLENGNYTHGDD